MKPAQRLADAHNLAQPILHRDLTARLDVSVKDWLRRTVQAVQGPGLQSAPDVELLGHVGSWLLASEVLRGWQTPTQGIAGVHKVHQVLQPHCPQKVAVALDELDKLVGFKIGPERGIHVCL